MKVLLQRVKRASVEVDAQCIARIGGGLLVFVAIESGDGAELIAKALHKILNYRVFCDDNGKMNRSVQQQRGDILLVPQFTLAADTDTGLRPSFANAAEPAIAKKLYLQLVQDMESFGLHIATGRFGADMSVSLVNDGPVTFNLSF